MLRKLGAVAATAAVGIAVAASRRTPLVEDGVGQEQLVLADDRQPEEGREGRLEVDPGRLMPHNVTPASGSGGSKTSSKKGFTFSKSFSKAGPFRYVCTIHSSMKMSVKVS